MCSRNVKIVPDCSLESVAGQEFDAVIVPGGLKGAETCASVNMRLNTIKLKLKKLKI